ncbi:IS1 family transposase [Xenorhabdus bovienii]|uniref:IS1 family transposase n=1 Tax=Xenorhabdus bovienii TaxID=40576 RepID=UPI003BAA4743|nr:IS1 family transposase [Xenorhabdus bovienii]
MALSSPCPTLFYALLLAPFHIRFITTDGWGSYAREVEPEKHLVGKIWLCRIKASSGNMLFFFQGT